MPNCLTCGTEFATKPRGIPKRYCCGRCQPSRAPGRRKAYWRAYYREHRTERAAYATARYRARKAGQSAGPPPSRKRLSDAEARAHKCANYKRWRTRHRDAVKLASLFDLRMAEARAVLFLTGRDRALSLDCACALIAGAEIVERPHVS